MARDRERRASGGLFGAALDSVLPNRCVSCDRRVATAEIVPERAFCLECEATLPWWRAVDGCPRCGDPTSADVAAACPRCLAAGSPLHRCESVLRYAGAIARWIPAWKREGRTFGPPSGPTRAVDAFAHRLAGEVVTRHAPIDVLVSVPIHPRRHFRRGFDQAAWIASRIARHGGPPVAAGWLQRVRATPPQAALAGDARRANVRGAFIAAARLPEDVRIGLVDDVLTTGSTLEAAADVLLEAGAGEVRALTLAATLPPAARRRATTASPRSARGSNAD